MNTCPHCNADMAWTGWGEDNEPFEFWCPECLLHFWPDADTRDDDVIFGSFSLFLRDYGGEWVSAWQPVLGAPKDPNEAETLEYWPPAGSGGGLNLIVTDKGDSVEYEMKCEIHHIEMEYIGENPFGGDVWFCEFCDDEEEAEFRHSNVEEDEDDCDVACPDCGLCATEYIT